MTASFGFTFGIKLTGLKAADVLDELETIRDRDGLTARNVVNAARPADSLLHPVFEWDAERAAELYREMQARCLIKSVRVSVGKSDEPAFVHVAARTCEAGEYERTQVVVRDADMRREALRELRDKVAAINRTIALLERTDSPPPRRVLAAATELAAAVEEVARA